MVRLLILHVFQTWQQLFFFCNKLSILGSIDEWYGYYVEEKESILCDCRLNLLFLHPL